MFSSFSFFTKRNLRQFVCDGNEITHFPASLLSMENLRLITAKNSWLLPSFAKEENSKKPPVRSTRKSFSDFRLFFLFE